MKTRTGAALFTSLILVMGALTTGTARAAPSSIDGMAGAPGAGVVATKTGPVRGVVAHGVENFLGIPYAAPPTGDLRWRSPQPAARWQGVRSAQSFGGACPQALSIDSPRIEDEDCLFVNVERPLGTNSGAKLPVFVYIHGGGFSGGSGDNENPNRVVEQNGVIGVTMNYRLGVFGFLAHPSLTAEDGESGNYALEDQQAALRWVQDNIKNFGGDPSRVTISGESAGGFSVCGHLVSPGSRGLFSQAIMQSGACTITRTLTAAETAGVAFGERFGCTGTEAAACLREQSAGALLNAPSPGNQLVRGTSTLPVDPRVEIAAGNFARVPIVIGSTLDEGRAFSQSALGYTREQYEASVRQRWGVNADAVLTHYPWPEDADQFSAAYLLGAITTDTISLGGCQQRQLENDIARYVPTWAYEWATRGGVAWYDVPGYDWGAGHATELPYLFPDRNGGANAAAFDARARSLAVELRAYWGAFVIDGTPQVAGLTEWPEYVVDRERLFFTLDGTRLISDAEYVANHQCEFWATLGIGV